MDKQINKTNLTNKDNSDIITPMNSSSRMLRIEEKRTRKQLIYVIGGSVGIILLVIFLGIPLLIKFSVIVGNMKSGNNIIEQTDKTPPFPPILSSLNSATNSASLKIDGYAEPETTLKLFLNDKEVKKTLLSQDGSFSFTDLTLKPGENQIYATTMDVSNNESSASAILKINYIKDAPKLEVTEPQDGQSFDKNHQEISISGKTDAGNNVWVNGRFVVVKDDGSFTMKLRLNDGENLLTISSKDPAGNETKVEKKVIFAP